MEGEKVKFALEESTKIQRYSSTLSLTWALDGVVSQRHDPAGLSPGKKPGTHCTVSWMGSRHSPHRDSITGPSSPYSQSLYWTVPAHKLWRVAVNICKESRIVDKGWSASLEAEWGANKLLSVKKKMLQNVRQNLGLREILWNDLSNGKWKRDFQFVKEAQDRDKWQFLGVNYINGVHAHRS
jgi:hypothetical protein